MSDELDRLAFEQAQALEFFRSTRERFRRVGEARARARTCWNDNCARQMERAYLEPIMAHWERLAAGLTEAAEAVRTITAELKEHSEMATRATRIIAELHADLEPIARGLRDVEYHQEQAHGRLEQARDALEEVDGLLSRLPISRL